MIYRFWTSKTSGNLQDLDRPLIRRNSLHAKHDVGHVKLPSMPAKRAS